MVKRDIHVSDIAPFDNKPMRNQIEADQRYLDVLLNRSQIPPLDGAVPERDDYYSLGIPPQRSRRAQTRRNRWAHLIVFALVLVACAAIFKSIKEVAELYEAGLLK